MLHSVLYDVFHTRYPFLLVLEINSQCILLPAAGSYDGEQGKSISCKSMCAYSYDTGRRLRLAHSLNLAEVSGGLTSYTSKENANIDVFLL